MSLQQVTANDIASLPAGSVSNTQFATGAVETYMSAQSSSFGFRNRIINGAMVIDQRNGGASQTPTSNQNIVDRWVVTMGQASKFTTQLSTNAPAGFTSSLQISTTSAYSGSYFYLYQYIEGYNFADMAWGTSSAKPVTVSFWVNSSITGTFGTNFFRNNAQDTQPTFSYTVNNSNTWEYKTVTVSGQTTGTWLTNNGIGTGVFFNLANTIGTLGATFYITGVQVEKGSTASAFEYRDYGRELIMCQRYYYQTPASTVYISRSCAGLAYSTSGLEGGIFSFPVTMRTGPTLINNNLTFYSPYLGRVSSAGTIGLYQSFTDSAVVNATGVSSFTAGNIYYVSGNSSAYAGFNAEL
jgi:hypothetical protein